MLIDFRKVVYIRDFEKICFAIASELAKYLGKSLKQYTPAQPKKETNMANSLTSTAKEDLKSLLKTTFQKGIIKVDHSEKLGL